MRTATLTIHLDAIVHNLGRVHHLAPNANILAMVKANAYGHGVANVLPALQMFADSLEDSNRLALGVATLQEAIELRKLGWSHSIGVIEGVFSFDEWQMAHQIQAQCVIHQHEQVEWALSDVPSDGSPTRKIWLKLNTGMNRLGFEPNEITSVAKTLNNAGYDLILTSHFANAEDVSHPLNRKQIQTFNNVLVRLKSQVSPNIQASLCNSAGIINFPDCHYNWVRPGIMLYGSSPIIDKSAEDLNLRPTMIFGAKVMAIHHLQAGQAVGYGSRFVCERPTVKGIISVGYGDGYPRVVTDEAWVSVVSNGETYQCPIIGRVAMDMIAMDLTDVPEPKIGDDVVLWGDANLGHPSVDDVASWAGTIGYELLCRTTGRPIKNVT